MDFREIIIISTFALMFFLTLFVKRMLNKLSARFKNNVYQEFNDLDTNSEIISPIDEIDFELRKFGRDFEKFKIILGIVFYGAFLFKRC